MMQKTSNTYPKRKKRTDRRGSVILLAIATLAIIAIAGLSYMTVVSLDRSSSGAYANQTNYRQQVTGVTEHIGALLTADLFGNKIVTTSTPRYPQNSGSFEASYWPKMFEDGETWDAPMTARVANGSNLFDTPGNFFGAPDDSAKLEWTFSGPRGRYEVAPPDDAWLASTEPEDWDNDGLIDGFRQITNLRSAYTLRDENRNGEIDTDEGWVRDDGAFVDLFRWIVEAQDFRGNPGADLWDFSDSDLRSRASRFGLSLADGDGAEQGINQMTHSLQLDQLFIVGSGDEPSDEDSQLNHIDYRRWADTDGDTFPDARWQQLDVLGELFGLRWFVAARIIDNSALVNVNSAISSGIDDDSGDLDPCIGLTPADIDFRRLLRHATKQQARHPDVTVPPIAYQSAMAEHLARGLQGPAVLDRINTIVAPHSERLNKIMYEDWQSTFRSLAYGEEPSSGQREAMWRFFGSDPFNPVISAGAAYPLTDEIDLRTYWGSNDLIALSKIEQRIDGPEEVTSLFGPLYLPGFGRDYPRNESLGLMRSKEDPANVRRFGEQEVELPGATGGTYELEDKQLRLQRDLRRRLTTVNGSGTFAPVPPLNTSQENASQFVNYKVRLDESELGSDVLQVQARAIRKSFEYLMWALAPFATDEPLFLNNQLGWDYADPMAPNSRHTHYGGGASTMPTTVFGGTMLDGADYALMRAASLAVNLADAIDEDQTPSVARFFHNSESAFRNALGPSDVTVLSSSMTHGDILGTEYGTSPLSSTLFPVDASTSVPTGTSGMAFVGLDRQPFLREVYSLAVYRDRAMDVTVVPDPTFDQLIEGDEPDENCYGMLAVELGNPWPDQIALNDYTVRIGTEDKFFTFGIPNPTIIPAGGYAVFYFDVGTDSDDLYPGEGEDIRDAWLDTLMPGGVSDSFAVLEPLDFINAVGLTNPTDPGARMVFFHELINELPSNAYLLREGDDLPFPVLVDRMENPESSRASASDYTDFFPAGLETGGIVDLSPLDLGGDPSVTGYVAYTSSLTRPARSGVEGFPPYVLEFPNGVANSNAHHFDDGTTAINGDLTDLFRDLETEASAIDIPTSFGIFFSDQYGVGNVPIGQPDKPDSDAIIAGYVASNTYPIFQLFVPNEPFASPTEVGLVSTYAHVCNNSNFGDLASWMTVSEQLAADTERYLDGSPGPNNLNPYFGVLNSSRYVIGGEYLSGDDLDDVLEAPSFMRVPLATRVFDCFEALSPPSDLVHGRMNINTASLDTLRLLPHTSPETTLLPLEAPSDLAIEDPATDDRAKFMDMYRQAVDPVDSWPPSSPPNMQNRQTLTDIQGLRLGGNLLLNGAQPIPAFTNTGELSLLAEWDTAGGGATGLPSVPQMGQFGAQNFQNGGIDGLNGQASWFDLRRNAVESANWPGAPQSYDPFNDQEERLAFYRAVSNVVSTRSDVYTAWFVIRAYDPEAIEGLEVLSPPNNEEMRDIFEELRPTYETRWLAVFDRSRVRKPTDRPRILLLAELPPT